MMHEVPGQQSPLMVHEPPGATQLAAAQRRAPAASRTQGTLSQQSDEEAHSCPAAMHVVPRPLQRGTPKVSRRHSPDLAPRPPQQLAEADEMLHA
jgi:hypothetical protein